MIEKISTLSATLLLACLLMACSVQAVPSQAQPNPCTVSYQGRQIDVPAMCSSITISNLRLGSDPPIPIVNQPPAGESQDGYSVQIGRTVFRIFHSQPDRSRIEVLSSTAVSIGFLSINPGTFITVQTL